MSCLIIDPTSAGMTSMPLRFHIPIPRSEGPACRVRRTTLDDPLRFGGHDRRAPRNFRLEGRACRVRCTTLDHPFQFNGRDRRAARIPRRIPRTCISEGIQGLNRRKGSGSAKNRTIDTVRPCHVCDVLVSTVSCLYAHIPPLTPRGIGTLYLY